MFECLITVGCSDELGDRFLDDCSSDWKRYVTKLGPCSWYGVVAAVTVQLVSMASQTQMMILIYLSVIYLVLPPCVIISLMSLIGCLLTHKCWIQRSLSYSGLYHDTAISCWLVVVHLSSSGQTLSRRKMMSVCLGWQFRRTWVCSVTSPTCLQHHFIGCIRSNVSDNHFTLSPWPHSSIRLWPPMLMVYA